MSFCKWVAAAAALALLAGCTPALVKHQGSPALRAAQRERAALLAGTDRWTIKARLGVSDGRHGGSGSLTWVQNGARYTFTLRAPITGRSFELRGGPEGAVLRGLDKGPLYGPDAQRLLARALGWQVPMRQLRAWVLGLRAEGSHGRLVFGDNGLPSQIRQDGWTVQYPQWFAKRRPALPRKVFATRAPYKVRVSIESWNFRKPLIESCTGGILSRKRPARWAWRRAGWLPSQAADRSGDACTGFNQGFLGASE